MSEAAAMEHFEKAFAQSVADGASADEIEHALGRMDRRLEQLKIAQGEFDGDD